jgi:hypothetical protein
VRTGKAGRSRRRKIQEEDIPENPDLSSDDDGCSSEDKPPLITSTPTPYSFISSTQGNNASLVLA